MRIFTHNIHSGYDAELAKTGHEFLSTDAFKAWDPEVRPRPPNWLSVEAPEGKIDVILVSHVWKFVPRYSSIPAPMIFNVIADCSEGIFPPEIEDRCFAVAFLAREVAARWTMKDPTKKRVIEMGIDPEPFLPHVGDVPRTLTVGHRIGQRWDKGHCPYVTVSHLMPDRLVLVGPGNEGLPGAVGGITHAALMEMYARNRVYFNPGPIIGISVAEAMTAGMPVVAFRPINLQDLIVDGVNGFIVDTVDGAVLKIRRLLENPEMARRMGAESRRTALRRFDSIHFVRQWNSLLEEAAQSGPPK